jgi:hypothetical protein
MRTQRRKPFTLEDVAANIANWRACWTPGTHVVMSEDTTPGQLERRGINTSDNKLKKPCPLAAYTGVGEMR